MKQYVSNCDCVIGPIVLWHYYINDYVIVIVTHSGLCGITTLMIMSLLLLHTQACCILQLMKYIVKLQSKGWC